METIFHFVSGVATLIPSIDLTVGAALIALASVNFTTICVSACNSAAIRAGNRGGYQQSPASKLPRLAVIRAMRPQSPAGHLETVAH
jgi:hypothetical protein